MPCFLFVLSGTGGVCVPMDGCLLTKTMKGQGTVGNRMGKSLSRDPGQFPGQFLSMCMQERKEDRRIPSAYVRI